MSHSAWGFDSHLSYLWSMAWEKECKSLCFLTVALSSILWCKSFKNLTPSGFDDVNCNNGWWEGKPTPQISWRFGSVFFLIVFISKLSLNRKMSSPLVARTASICRSAFTKPTVFSTVRFSSSQTKDVQHLEKEPVLSVENLSGAPGNFLILALSAEKNSINMPCPL